MRQYRFRCLLTRNDANVGNSKAGCGNPNSLLGQNADIPFAPVLEQPTHKRALEIAVIVFPHVSFDELPFQQLLVRAITGIQVLADRH